MLFELPVPWLIALNVAAWPVIQLGFAWIGVRLGDRLVRPNGPLRVLFRERRIERGGRLYERLFAVRAWKGRLPDGAAMFRAGFRKSTINTRDRAFLDRYRLETCRGELVHWAAILIAPLFFLWNPPWAGAVMIAYALIANAPCIIAQRYNRIRLTALLSRERPRVRDVAATEAA